MLLLANFRKLNRYSKLGTLALALVLHNFALRLLD